MKAISEPRNDLRLRIIPNKAYQCKKAYQDLLKPYCDISIGGLNILKTSCTNWIHY